LDAAQALASERGLTGRIDWAVAARVVASHDGVARDVTSGRAADHRELGTP
jgi:hypothetical protein